MSQVNRIQQIPKDIKIKGKTDDKILYALAYFGPMERREFLNDINKNTFHKYAKE